MAVQLAERPALSGAAPAGDAFPDVLEILDERLDRASSAPVAVGFSGGGDSLAALLAVRTWAARAGRPVLALTVDHGLQSASQAWTLSAADTAHNLGAGFRSLTWTGPKPTKGLAAAARRARHALLAQAARAAGASVIVLGHTRDDVLEADLMRAEGSTLGRMAQWSPSPVWPEGHGVFLLRPLLDLRRAELRRRLAVTGLTWIEDPANDDPRSTRARARRRLAEGAPSPVPAAPVPNSGNLASLALAAREDRFGGLCIAREALAKAAPRDARRFLALACVCAGGGERLPRTERVERLQQRIGKGEVFVGALAGARIEVGAADVRFGRDAGECSRGGLAPIRLEPGLPAVWDGRFEVTAEEVAVIGALRGCMSRLAATERSALRAAPAAVRPALPAAIRDGEDFVSCPILAPSGNVRAGSLVGERLIAACGEVVREVHSRR